VGHTFAWEPRSAEVIQELVPPRAQTQNLVWCYRFSNSDLNALRTVIRRKY
jgi:hypothetical protein